MSQEFNFDIDKIANNAISKSDKTTEIIEANTTQENGQHNFSGKADSWATECDYG